MSLFASLDSLKNTVVGLKSSSKAKRTSTLSKEIAPCFIRFVRNILAKLSKVSTASLISLETL